MSTVVTAGFTGSRYGMTTPQMRAVSGYLSHILLIHDTAEPAGIQVRHGDCIGSDAQFHVIATVLGCRTVAHPPLNERLRAYCAADEILPPKDYLARDRDIVAGSAALVATPGTSSWQRHSGTWTTIGYAVDAGLPVTVCLPDGTILSGRELATLRQ
jgi:hypothetical protein